MFYFDDLVQSLKSYSAADVEVITRTYHFAEHAHAGQLRASSEPYITHPTAAAIKLAELNLDAPTIMGALLHDTLDDTHTTEQDLIKAFGQEVAFLVKGVSQLGQIRHKHLVREKSLPISEREEYARVENMRNMIIAMAKDIRVVLIKLADRMHNMETLRYLPVEKQRVIARETLEVYAPLAWRLGMGEWKGPLEDLAFPYLYPEEHRALMERVRDSSRSRAEYLERIKPVIREELERERITLLGLETRPKHTYSLWKKLQRPDITGNLELVYDLVALRLIVETTEVCYATLGVIHKLFRPLPGRIKDYIALPKPNGYQSLHTTVFGLEGTITEIQIRTPEMHHEAEYGIAAHWTYKTSTERGEGKSPARERRFRWIGQLRRWQRAKTPQEFLESLKIDVFNDRIFVFTPLGGVIDLPVGATPIDFAYAIHSKIGEECVGAYINGAIAPLSSHLENGDVVEILRQKNKKPSPDWLGIVKTASARDKIRSRLKHHLKRVS